jgi:hypothetical protein
MEFSWDSLGFGWKRMKNSFIHYQARESGGKLGAHVTRSLQKGCIYFRAKGIVILCAIHVLSSFFAAHREEEDGAASTSIGAGRSGIQIFFRKNARNGVFEMHAPIAAFPMQRCRKCGKALVYV